MPSVTRRVTTADGVALLVREWPTGSEPWADLLLVHGLGEHSGRYEHVGDHLGAAGLRVHGYDHRGNGASGGRRGDVDRWSRLHDDLAARLAAVRASAGDGPVVLYGHSMGGLIVAGYCLAGYPLPDAVVLASPGLDSTLANWKKRLAPVLARVWPAAQLPNDVDLATLSRDPGVAAAVSRDPLCATHSTARFGAAGLAEQARVRTLAPRGLGVPTLVLHGEDDGLVPSAASAVFALAPATTRRTFPGLRHELHNEPEGVAILDEVVAWMRATVRLPRP
jgi:alpha-beta hydrolase superfamily lysophospholipase